MTRYVFSASDFRPWKCPACKRVVQILSDRTSVMCGGGWIMVSPAMIPWHEPTECYMIPISEADPIDLAKAMGILSQDLQLS